MTRLCKILLVGLLGFGLFSCNAVKYVPDGQHLLVNNHIEKDEGDISSREFNKFIRQKPNKRIFGFIRFHLGLYNLARPDGKGKISNGLRTIGEAPVLYDPVLTIKTIDQLTTHLSNKGYRNAKVRDSLVLNGKKAEVIYKINFGEPFRITSYDQYDTALISDQRIFRVLEPIRLTPSIRQGMRFDKDLLQDERKRIAGYLQSNGYYNFNREFIWYQADTLQQPHSVNLALGVQNPPTASGTAALAHPWYRIGSISVIPDYSPAEFMVNPDGYNKASDTLLFNNIDLIYRGKLQIKPEILWSSLHFREGEVYNKLKVDESIRSLSGLRNFRQINLNFIPVEKVLDSAQVLDCVVLLTPEIRQSYDVSLEGTYSSGNIGVAGNLIYKHRNLMKGAEYFELKFKGAVEFLADAVADFNRMMEFGVETRLDIPRTWIPFVSVGSLQGAKPNSTFSLSYNYQQRPDFTRTIANAGFGYRWASNDRISHRLNILEFNYVNVTNLSDAFYNIIRGTYIENSFRSHVIPAFNYYMTISNQEVEKDKSFYYFRFRPEIAGNSLSVVNQISDREKPEGGYNLFGTPYSQYALADVDFRYTLVVNPTNRFAFRVFAGAGYPYGNLDALPFEKKYFSGGSNGIRAWQVRSLGPGRYVMSEDQKKYYPNQMGDIKLEFNFEYRFDLFWKMKGAAFFDSGNIWAIRDADDRVGAQFSFATFYKEIAIGTGLGLRFDFDFLLARLDLGVKVRDPGTPDGPRWLPGYRPYQWSDFVLNFGIGYPF